MKKVFLFFFKHYLNTWYETTDTLDVGTPRSWVTLKPGNFGFWCDGYLAAPKLELVHIGWGCRFDSGTVCFTVLMFRIFTKYSKLYNIRIFQLQKSCIYLPIIKKCQILIWVIKNDSCFHSLRILLNFSAILGIIK